jgi:O-antigen ligase
LFALLLYKTSRGEKFLFTGPQTGLFAAFMGCAFLSVPLSLHPSRAFSGTTSDLLKVFALFVLTMNLIRNLDAFRKLLWAVLLFGLFPAIGHLLAFYMPEQFAVIEWDIRMGWAGYFENANYLAACMAVMVAVGLGLLTITRSHALKAVAVGIVLLDAYVLLHTLSRAGLLSLAAVVFIFTVTSKHKTRNLVVLGLVGMLFLPKVPGLLERASTIATYSEEASAASRPELWKAGLKMAVSRPFWGVGVDCFPIGSGQYFSGYASAEGGLGWKVAHNAYVQVMAEMGFAAFGIFLALLWLSIRDNWRLHKRMKSIDAPGADDLAQASRAIMLVLISICVISTTHDFAYEWMLHMFIALTVCLKQMSWRYDELPVQDTLAPPT